MSPANVKKPAGNRLSAVAAGLVMMRRDIKVHQTYQQELDSESLVKRINALLSIANGEDTPANKRPAVFL